MLRLFSLVLLLLTLSGPSSHAQTPEQLQKRLNRLVPDLVDATVAVLVGPGAGSGVIISPDGLVLTAAHVTGEPGQQVKIILSDGREVSGTTLGVDHTTDAAMLQIDGAGRFPFRPYQSEKAYQEGDLVIATGHPGGPIQNRPPPVRLGRIRAAGTKSGFADPLTSTATVISGDSGGALFNLEGTVIGIHSNISGSYSTNNHVPLPAFIERWDELLEGAHIGRQETSEEVDPRDRFDRPLAAMRRQFQAALEANAEDPEAAELLARPRLLDAHQMERLLHRWGSSVEGEFRPWFGIEPDLTDPTTARIARVTPGSPAEKAGLAAGDVVIGIDGEAVASPTSLLLHLARVEEARPVVFSVLGKEVRISPEMRPARGHYGMEITGMISMQISGEGGAAVDSSVLPGVELGERAKAIQIVAAGSVVALYQGDSLLGHATVVSAEGELLAKASELGELGDELVDLQCNGYPVELVGVDPEFDLALLRTGAPDLVPVVWAEAEPRTASLLFTSLPDKVVLGVMTQPGRTVPAEGREADRTEGVSNVWLGASLIPGEEELVVGRVENSSPADRADLFEGDVILRVDGREVTTEAELTKVLSRKAVGDKVRLLVSRSDQEKKLEAILEAPPEGLFGYSKKSAMRDRALSNTSQMGGKLSDRRYGFPRALYHDQILLPEECGSPLFDLEGRAVGINVARVFRHRSLAIPAKEARAVLARLRGASAR